MTTCDDCKDEIALTDVQGHYDGNCLKCRKKESEGEWELWRLSGEMGEDQEDFERRVSKPSFPYRRKDQVGR